MLGGGFDDLAVVESDGQSTRRHPLEGLRDRLEFDRAATLVLRPYPVSYAQALDGALAISGIHQRAGHKAELAEMGLISTTAASNSLMWFPTLVVLYQHGLKA